MPKKWKRGVLSAGMAVLGIAALLLAWLLVLPIAVNWPASWFGALFATVIATAGLALVYRGIRRLLAG